MASEPDEAGQPLRKVIGVEWHKETRHAVLTCGHRVGVSLKEAMPATIACPDCPPRPPLEPA